MLALPSPPSMLLVKNMFEFNYYIVVLVPKNEAASNVMYCTYNVHTHVYMYIFNMPSLNYFLGEHCYHTYYYINIITNIKCSMHAFVHKNYKKSKN